MIIDAHKHTEEDIEVIKRQLGCKHVYVYGIASRCKFGCPQILLLNPFEGAKKGELNLTALVTPLWLSCPYLNQRIHDIENGGAIQRFQKIIKSDREFSSRMSSSHAHYYFFRKKLYYEITGVQYPEELTEHFNRGIGGIKNIDSLKCLHLHYSHYKFCNTNIAGRMVALALQNDINCQDGMCRCM